MKLVNFHPAPELRSSLRSAAKHFIETSVDNALIDDYIRDGWNIARHGKRTSRMMREKPLEKSLPDRVLTLFARMGFSHLSGGAGATLTCTTPNGTVENQLDVTAADEDVALYVECRTAAKPHGVPRFAEDVAHLDGLRQCFLRAISKAVGRRKVAALYWSQNLLLSGNDLERAAEKNVRVFAEEELRYYEDLVRQLGTAARFQLLADVFEHSKVDSLVVRVPAVCIRLGPTRCFSFALSPERLLKIAYVSHRAKAKRTDVDTYQRLLKRPRLKDIRDYIEAGGYFPTNIVVNFQSRRPLQFDKTAAPANVETTAGEMGWLTLPGAYKSAWIIDGQHRLYAYANGNQAATSELSVLAFDNLPPSEQARLFVDINAKQRSVKQNLLVELWAELHWDSDNLEDRVRAIIAKLVLTLDGDHRSPFFGRIIKADSGGDYQRVISLKALTSALEHPDLFVTISPKVGVIPGALWQQDPFMTIGRTADVLNTWFTLVMTKVRDNWDKGKGLGGALGMNDSVVAIVAALRSVLQHHSEHGVRLYDLETAELLALLKPYAEAIGDSFAAFNAEEFAYYRGLRGIQGQTTRMRDMQIVLHARFPDFMPGGLQDYIESRDKNATKEARELIDRIELSLREEVLRRLKEEFGEDGSSWWYHGVPKGTRERILKEINDEGRESPWETHFTLIDYRNIALENWTQFKDTIGDGKANESKDKRTQWLSRVNEIRKYAMHATKGRAKPDDVLFLRLQAASLAERLSTETEPQEP